MKHTKNLLVLVPLLFSTAFISNSFYIFLVATYPKFNEMHGRLLSLIYDGKLLHNYGSYLLIYAIAVLVITLFVIGSVLIKKELNLLLFLIVVSSISIYSVNVLNSISSVLLIEGIYLPLEAAGDKQLKINHAAINSCGCLECISNFKQSIK